MQDSSTPSMQRAMFHGTGGQLFAIFVVNVIFTILTLGIYYPWARVNILKYYYGETEFMGDSFEFHGTGKELFVGFIKVFAIFILLGIISSMGAWVPS